MVMQVSEYLNWVKAGSPGTFTSWVAESIRKKGTAPSLPPVTPSTPTPTPFGPPLPAGYQVITHPKTILGEWPAPPKDEVIIPPLRRSPFADIQNISELFPGMNSIISGARIGHLRSQKTVNELGQKLSIAESAYTRYKAIDAPQAMALAGPQGRTIDIIQKQLDSMKAEVDSLTQQLKSATTEMHRAEWRDNLATGLLTFVQDPDFPKNADDALKIMQQPGDGGFQNDNITEEDKKWFSDYFDSLRPFGAPEKPSTPAEVRELLTIQKRPIMISLAKLTSDEIIRSLKVIPVATLPDNLTDTQLMSLIADFKFTDEEQKTFTDAHQVYLEYSKMWNEERARNALVLKTLQDPNHLNLSLTDFTKMLAVSPMMATAEVLGIYYRKVPEAIAAALIANFPIQLENTSASELRAAIEDYKSQGMSTWDAYGYAFENWDTNALYKMAITTLLDPTTYIGLSIASRFALKIPYLGKPYLGPFVGAIESGWNKAWDTPFLAIRYGVGGGGKLLGKGLSHIPKTPGQAAVLYAQDFYMNLRSFAGRVLADPAHYTPDNLKTLLDTAIESFRADPMNIADPGVRLAMQIAEHDYISEDIVREWIRTLGAEGIVVDNKMLFNLEGLFDKFWKKQSGSTLAETADKVLARLGIESSDTAIAKMSKLLTKYEDTLVKEAKGRYVGETVKNILSKMRQEQESIFLRKVNSPIWKFAEHDGEVTAWSAGIDRVLHWHWIDWFDRNITLPAANLYLNFTSYGVFNLGETMVRSFLGGHSVWVPSGTDALSEFSRYSLGLSNANYEFIRAYEYAASVKGEMALLQREGKTIFDKIPGVTKKGPFGFSLNLKGLGKYPIYSMNDWSQLMADIQNRIRAYNTTRAYFKKLSELYPEEVKSITDIFLKHQQLLDGVSERALPDKAAVMTGWIQDGLTSADLILTHDVPLTDLENRVVFHELQPALEGATELPPPLIQIIEEAVKNGSIFKDTSKFMSRVYETARDMSIATLAVQTKLVDRLASDLLPKIASAKSAHELNQDLKFLTELLDSIDSRISEARSQITTRAHSLDPTTRQAYHDSSNKLVLDYLDSAQSTFDFLTEQIRRVVDGEDFAIDWTKVSIDPALSDLPIQEWIKDVPIEIQAKLRKITVSTNPQEYGSYTAYSGGGLAINLSTLAEAASLGESPKPTFFHEIMHAYQAYRVDEMKDYKLLLDWMDTIGAPKHSELRFLVQQAELEGRSSSTLYDDFNRAGAKHPGIFRFGDWDAMIKADALNPEEILTYAFEGFTTGVYRNPWVERNLSKIETFINTNMPMKLAHPKLTIKNQQVAQQMLSSLRRSIVLLDETRKEEMALTSKLIRQKPRNAPNEWWQNNFYPPREAVWAKRKPAEYQLQAERSRLLGSLTDYASKKSSPKIEHIAAVNPEDLSPAHIAYIFNTTGDSLTAALLHNNSASVMPREKFIALVMDRAAQVGRAAEPPGSKLLDSTLANRLGFTKKAVGDVYDQMLRTVNVDPALTASNPFWKLDQQIKDLTKSIQGHGDAKALPKSDQEKLHRFYTEVAADLKELPLYKGLVSKTEGKLVSSPLGEEKVVEAAAPPIAHPAESWFAKKDAAMLEARRQVQLSYTDYGSHNAIDSAMTHIFPFWQYESQRFFWLPRTFLRTPGVLTGIGRYMDYTDNGYISIPGTDYQFNPLRGSVFMGGFSRLYQKDYPDYHDAFPGAKILSFIGRAGFFPGATFTLPQAIWGSAANLRPEFGDVLPPFARSILDIVATVAPSKALNEMTQIIFPDRFRDYMTVMKLTSQGHDGLAIWSKWKNNEPLTEYEQTIWSRGVREVMGTYGLMMEQTGIFRLRTQEYQKFRENSKLVIQQLTGIPVETQQRISDQYPSTGKRLEDYYHLDILTQKFINELSGYDRWAGVTTPLQPSWWGIMDSKRQAYWGDVQNLQDESKLYGSFDENGKLTSQSLKMTVESWLRGDINARQFLNARSAIAGDTAAAITALGKSTPYLSIPKTIDDLQKMYEERGIVVPPHSPDEELMYQYYAMKPELIKDEETGAMVRDFEGYYAKIDALLDALSPQQRDIFLNRVQSSWLPAEKLYWMVSRTYLRAYRNVTGLILDKYTSEQQSIINRVPNAEGAERSALMEVVDSTTGNKLYSQYSAEKTEFRKSMRQVSPMLDAWLNFWGYTTVFETPDGQSAYDSIRKQYFTPEFMLGEVAGGANVK